MGEEALVTEVQTGLAIARIRGASFASLLSIYLIFHCPDFFIHSLGWHTYHISRTFLPYFTTYSSHITHVHDCPVLPSS